MPGKHKALAACCDSSGSEDSSGGHHPGPSPGSPQRAGRRLPNSQAGVEQQRPESAHSIAASQSREHRLLLHQPGQPRAGALANLGGRVLELRDKSKVSGTQCARAPGAWRWSSVCPSPVPAPRVWRCSRLTHLFQQLRRWPVVIFFSVLCCCRLGLTVAGGRELRSLEAFRPTLSHGDARCGDGPRREGNSRLWGLRSS